MALQTRRYPRYLKWLTLVLLSYVAVLFVVEIDWFADTAVKRPAKGEGSVDATS